MSGNRCSAHRRDGRWSSLGKIEQPVGDGDGVLGGAREHSFTCLMLSQYRRADEAPVPGSQYSMGLSKSSSRVSAFSGQPSH
jgi:hypothetical protein